MSIGKQEGKVLHASHEGVHVLRFVGTIRHPMGPSLELYLQRLVEEKPSGLVLDFGETEIVDSTCLGLLARTAMQLRQQGSEKATLVSPVADITEVFRSMSFDRLFHIVGEMPFDLGLERPVRTRGESSQDDLLATMLGAHRTLMSLSEHNRMQFKDVVEALEREAEKRQDEPESGRRSA